MPKPRKIHEKIIKLQHSAINILDLVIIYMGFAKAQKNS